MNPFNNRLCTNNIKEPTERELLEKLAEAVDVRAEDLLNAILHLREEKFRERQADLKEILKNG